MGQQTRAQQRINVNRERYDNTSNPKPKPKKQRELWVVEQVRQGHNIEVKNGFAEKWEAQAECAWHIDENKLRGVSFRVIRYVPAIEELLNG